MGNRRSKTTDQTYKGNSDSQNQDDLNIRYNTTIHSFKFEQSINSNKPSTGDLNLGAIILNDRIYDHSTGLLFNENERHLDTCAIAVDQQNKEILVAFNTKARDTIVLDDMLLKNTYPNFGIDYDKHGQIIGEFAGYLQNVGNYQVTAVTTEERATNPQDNAKPHAEMQLLQYAKEKNIKLSRIGINKPPCSKCKNELDKNNVEHEHLGDGNPKVKNWQDPSKIKTKAFYQNVPNKIKLVSFKWIITSNIPQTSKQFIRNTQNHAALCLNFNCSLNTRSLLDMFNNFTTPYFNIQNYMYAQRGRYSNERESVKGIQAKAGVYEWACGKGPVFVKFDLLTASASAEIREDGVSAGIKATLVSVQLSAAGIFTAQMGISASTGVSLGFDEIQVQILGSGFRIGPKEIQLQTPIISISINPNLIVGVAIIFLYSFPNYDDIDDIGGNNNISDKIKKFKELIESLFGGKPPPSPPSSGLLVNQQIERQQFIFPPNPLLETLLLRPQTTLTIPLVRLETLNFFERSVADTGSLLQNVSEKVANVLSSPLEVRPERQRQVSRQERLLYA